MSLQHSTTQSNNGKNNSNMERKYYYSFIFIPFLIKSSPIPAIRQRHYKTKRKEIRITLEDNKKAINIGINNGYFLAKATKGACLNVKTASKVKHNTKIFILHYTIK